MFLSKHIESDALAIKLKTLSLLFQDSNQKKLVLKSRSLEDQQIIALTTVSDKQRLPDNVHKA